MYVGRSLNSEDVVIYAFGEKWGPENDTKDKYFDFVPGNGIHDIHMNQGSVGRFQKDNGVWQDGGLLIHYPNREQWVGIFLTFQSQSFHLGTLKYRVLSIKRDSRIRNPSVYHLLSLLKLIVIICLVFLPSEGRMVNRLFFNFPYRTVNTSNCNHINT